LSGQWNIKNHRRVLLWHGKDSIDNNLKFYVDGRRLRRVLQFCHSSCNHEVLDNAANTYSTSDNRVNGGAMKTVKVTQGQYRALQKLTRQDLSTLKKYPKILAEARYLLRACKRVIKRVEAISVHANKRKRQTAYKRIVSICQKAIDRVEK
jgi:hypothetical protein